MAKLISGSSKNVTWMAIGGFGLIGLIGTIVLLVFTDPATPQQAEGTQQLAIAPAQRTDSLGTTTEGGASYNQLFQERVLGTVNTSMDQFRAETKATLDAYRKELESRNEQNAAQMQGLLERAIAAQQPQQMRAPDVERIQLDSTSSATPASASTDQAFVGGPADAMATVSNAVRNDPVPSIPPNGFIKGRTLNGIVAVVGAPPKGFLVKLTGRYQAANGFVVNLEGCTSYVEGRADLPSGRVMGKPATLTCNFADGTSKTWQVSGYVVDRDGIEGIVGVINDNSMKRLGGSTLAGGVALAGSALSRSQTQSMAGPDGVTQVFTGSIGKDITGGLVQGGGTEAGRQIQEHYNAYQSSVQVGGGREITLVLLNELAVPDAGKSITGTRGVPSSGG